MSYDICGEKDDIERIPTLMMWVSRNDDQSSWNFARNHLAVNRYCNENLVKVIEFMIYLECWYF